VDKYIYVFVQSDAVYFLFGIQIDFYQTKERALNNFKRERPEDYKIDALEQKQVIGSGPL
jgi:cephalosporin hydroxylase